MANKTATETLAILPKQLYLTKRNGSELWQCRYKVEDNWFRASTGKEDRDEAREAALEKMMETKYRQKLGVPIVTRKFKHVAELAKKTMQTEVEQGTGKVIYKHYHSIIDNYLIPFFGNFNIDSIDYPKLVEFEQWRNSKLGKTPAASTVNNYTSALNRVFDEAVSRGLMVQSKVPKTKNKGKKAEVRPTFTLDEYRQLYRFMRTWIKGGRKGKPRQMRELLRDYVLFLASSGIRHGTESYSLKWKNIRIDDDGLLIISVSGKTGRREAYLRRSGRRYLERIQQRTEALKGMSFEEALKQDKLVFTLPNGKQTTSLHQTFEVLLKEAGLLVDPNTGHNRTLYSMRHFYISQSIIHERVPLEYLAVQCGTSIAMIEKHYGHLSIHHKRDKLSG